MLMLLSVHVTSVLILVLVGNSALTMRFYWSLHALTLVARSYALLHQYICLLDYCLLHVRFLFATFLEVHAVGSYYHYSNNHGDFNSQIGTKCNICGVGALMLRKNIICSHFAVCCMYKLTCKINVFRYIMRQCTKLTSPRYLYCK